MFDKLPDFIDPIAAVNHDKRFSGRVNQSKLHRLKEVVVKASGDVLVDIAFYYDKAVKFPAFEMAVEAQLQLECQRSLQTFSCPVKTSTKGVFTESMSLVEELPKDYEVFELDPDDERISLFELVEEELLLAIPMIPVDESAELAFGMDEGEALEEPQLQENLNEAESKPNPFAALQALKK
ncbi:YceD family protein [Thiomicrorhabdus indica]|uniref:YceD family protein n=1 Tax=Thiomicrorhabdus indica TaxID=2267253 RepID=UPI002AA708C7|nr:YceD family protein [Thiomicrorhabdus indica]